MPLCLWSIPLFACVCVCVVPSEVQDLVAVAEDSVSILVSWRIPAQPNGLITQYRLQVLVEATLLQDITLTSKQVGQLLFSEKCSFLSSDLNHQIKLNYSWSSMYNMIKYCRALE